MKKCICYTIFMFVGIMSANADPFIPPASCPAGMRQITRPYILADTSCGTGQMNVNISATSCYNFYTNASNTTINPARTPTVCFMYIPTNLEFKDDKGYYIFNNGICTVDGPVQQQS